MKKSYVLLLSIALTLAFIGCAANSYTGSITAQNTSNIDATNLRVGNVFIGFVGKGQTITVYFYSAQSKAQIVSNQFSAPSDAQGTIDLKLNYQYNLTLDKKSSDYIFNCYGTPAGSDANSLQTSDLVFMD